MKFTGTIRQWDDGESTQAEGTLDVGNGPQKLVCSANGNYLEGTLEGAPIPDAIEGALEDFLAENWPDEGSPLWKPGAEEGELTADVTFG